MSLCNAVHTIMLPCRHSMHGCRMMLSLFDKAEHEEVCLFRYFKCPNPWPYCTWEGPLDRIRLHLQQAHPKVKFLAEGELVLSLDTESPPNCFIKNIFGHDYMLVVEMQRLEDGQLRYYIVVQLIGSKRQAERFRSTVELIGTERRLVWRSTPQSSEDGVLTAFLEANCLVFDTSLVEHLGEILQLEISVTSLV